MSTNLYTGVVESRDDPLKLGRCLVRIVGLHTEDKTILPTSDLPWAFPLQPITSAAINGIGWTPVGPVPGTWVVIMFHDEELQMPIMIGTIGGIPQSKASERVIDNSDSLATDGGVLVDSSGQPVVSSDGSTVSVGIATNVLGGIINDIAKNIGFDLGVNPLAAAISSKSPAIGTTDTSKPTITPQIVKAEDAKITAQPEPSKAADEVLTKGIPLDPPSKYASSKLAEKRKSIAALISACDKVGLTSKYAKCAVLAICGGESDWLPVEEGYSYSADALRKIFSGVFASQPTKADEYARWKGSRADFFKLIYSPDYKNGRGAGNKLPNDGAMFYGRGFNQITGRALYEQLERELKKLGIDAPISTNPDILINDIDTSALCTAMFYKLNVKHDINSPGYFAAALKRTGGAASGKEKKSIFYQYFLGQGVITDSTNKPTVDEQRTYTQEEVAGLPQTKQQALLEDRSDTSVVGFKDPSGKYPLRNLLDEPDTNRLSRGVIKETAIAFKDQSRTVGIATANGAGGTWEQPLAPFGGQYPYSKVYETESGHVQTFDDTPGHENVGLYHRKGTFIDVDANGTQVNKIVGDGYTVIDRNGFISIEGRCNIFIGNSANILVQGDADVEVNGATTATFHAQVDIGCATDVNLSVGGNFNVKVDGDYNTTVGGSTNTVITGNEAIQTSGNFAKSVTGVSSTQVNGAVTMKAGATIQTSSVGAYSVKTDGDMLMTGATQHIKASGGNVNVDGTQFRGQQGSSVSASVVASDVAPMIPLTKVAPSIIGTKGDTFDILQTPVRPAPPVELKVELLSQNDTAIAEFKNNPSKYYNAEAEAAGVNPERPPQIDIGEAAIAMPPSGATSGDIQEFLKKQLALAKEGHWSEMGMNSSKSNPNIIAMWKDLGFPQFTSDQIAWCAGFVNWTLKQCNYRYVQTARAYDIRDKTDKWKATKVTDPQPGDIVVWSYSHVNFVYDVLDNGNITCVGGNQGGGKVSNNNPTGGLVTISYPNGISPKHKTIVGIYRPSKA